MEFDICSTPAVIYFSAAPFFAFPALLMWDKTLMIHTRFVRSESTCHISYMVASSKSSPESFDIAGNRSFSPKSGVH